MLLCSDSDNNNDPHMLLDEKIFKAPGDVGVTCRHEAKINPYMLLDKEKCDTSTIYRTTCLLALQAGVGLRRGAAAWGCAEQLCGAAQWWGGCVGAQRHGGALGRSVWLYRGVAAWGCAGVQQRGAAPGRSSVGPRRGAAARGCA